MDARKDEDAMILLIVPDKYIVHIDQPFDSGSARTREKLLEIAAAEHEGIVRDYYFLGHAGEREPRAVPLVFRKLHVIMHVILPDMNILSAPSSLLIPMTGPQVL